MRRATNARRSRFVSKSHDTPYLTAKLRLIRFVARALARRFAIAFGDLSSELVLRRMRTKRKAMSGYFKAKSAGRRQIWSGARLRAAVPPADNIIPDFATLPI